MFPTFLKRTWKSGKQPWLQITKTIQDLYAVRWQWWEHVASQNLLLPCDQFDKGGSHHRGKFCMFGNFVRWLRLRLKRSCSWINLKHTNRFFNSQDHCQKNYLETWDTLKNNWSSLIILWSAKKHSSSIALIVNEKLTTWKDLMLMIKLTWKLVSLAGAPILRCHRKSNLHQKFFITITINSDIVITITISTTIIANTIAIGNASPVWIGIQKGECAAIQGDAKNCLLGSAQLSLEKQFNTKFDNFYCQKTALVNN